MTLLAYREVTVKLGFWEDVPGFGKTDAEFRSRLGELYPGAYVGGVTTMFEAWETTELDEIVGEVL